MKSLQLFLLSLLIPFQGVVAQEGAVLEGYVQDARTGDPLPGVHVWLDRSGRGSVTGAGGEFMIAGVESIIELSVSHIGYRSERLRVDLRETERPLQIGLEPVRMPLQGELLVTSRRMPAYYSGLYSDLKSRPVEDHMKNMAGLDLVSRANFAREPVIRGLRDSRVEIRIDGMRLTPACVDGMDPLTAYLESDNLEAIEITRGQSAGGGGNATGGSVNFHTARPDPGSGLSGSMETGYHSASGQQFYQGMTSWGGENWGVRMSGTYRNADDMVAGQGRRVDGSSFEKGNLHLSAELNPVPDHRLSARYIGDFAGRIGYPALLMDTDRADAHLLGMEHHWRPAAGPVSALKTTLYAGQVEHRMNDFARDVAARQVMSGMFMPMLGTTQTLGVSSEMNMVAGSGLIDLRAESWRVEAFGEMRMIPLDPSVSEMMLLNLGDVSNHNSLLSASYTYFIGSGWRAGLNGRLEAGANRLLNENARATYRAEYPGLEQLDPLQFTYMAGFYLEREFSGVWTAGVRLSQGTRLPDHLERYGYYIYQPLDGFFYIGNPALRPERSRQGELYLLYGDGNSLISGSTAIWVNRMDDYIAGHRTQELFKRMDNMGTAILTGTESEFEVQLHEQWGLSAALSWIFGHHRLLDEPLPMIPPLKGNVSALRSFDRVELEMRIRWAADQNRVADRNHLEERTPGHSVLDLFGRVRIGSNLRLQVGVENLFDTWFVDHLSVNSFPEPGRNLQVSLTLRIP